MLVPKAQVALERYGHQVVIGNALHNRKYEVVFISRHRKAQTTESAALSTTGVTPEWEYAESWLRIDPASTIASPSNPKPMEIEEGIIAELVARHDAWIAGGI